MNPPVVMTVSQNKAIPIGYKIIASTRNGYFIIENKMVKEKQND